ncbi:MAG: DUF928 domain-containing protein [Cyanobacteria bacterium P01_F01_bin.150]
MHNKKPCWQSTYHALLMLIVIATITVTTNSNLAHSILHAATVNRRENNIGLKAQGKPDWGERHDGNQAVAGTREYCPKTDYPLTTLVPKEVNWSLTTQSRPTFWLYMPYTAEQVSSAVFVIDDETSDFYHEVQVTLSREPGFVRFTLPDSIPALLSSRDYRWTFKVFCSEDSLTPIFVRGFVQFNEVEHSHLQDYQTYLDRLIWLDAVDVLAMQRLNDPSNTMLIDEWRWLLMSGGIDLTDVPLGPIIDAPLMVNEPSNE